MEWLLFESRLMQSQGFLIKELWNQNLELFNFWMKFRIMNQSAWGYSGGKPKVYAKSSPGGRQG